MTDHDDATVDEPGADEGLVLLPPADPVDDARRELAERLVEQARATGVDLVGPTACWPISPAGCSRRGWRSR